LPGPAATRGVKPKAGNKAITIGFSERLAAA
jgi:hypothetical protein